MQEDIVQMLPLLLLAGAIAGWLAEAIARAGGYGLIVDMAVGAAGAVAGGAIWWTLSTDTGMIGMSLIGGAAAGLTILAQRTWWRSARLGT
jgi:uncharacterized membrane protein YeaQ/YmgE (transglycosylase-associated protein family)